MNKSEVPIPFNLSVARDPNDPVKGGFRIVMAEGVGPAIGPDYVYFDRQIIPRGPYTTREKAEADLRALVRTGEIKKLGGFA